MMDDLSRWSIDIFLVLANYIWSWGVIGNHIEALSTRITNFRKAKTHFC